MVFNNDGVVRTRTDTKSKKPPKPKTFTFPGVFDLHSALLFVRSQPLHDGDVHRLVVYPATGAYLATLTVAAHSSVNVPAGSYKAIKLDVQLSKIGKKRELESHKQFRRASVLVSDDSDRLLLRIEARHFCRHGFCRAGGGPFSGGQTVTPCLTPRSRLVPNA